MIGRLSTLVSVERDGRETPLIEEPAAYLFPRISPDQTQLAVQIGGDVWTIDLARGTRTRIVTARGVGSISSPTWTRDSQAVTFMAAAEPDSADLAIFSVFADMSGSAQRLLIRPHLAVPTSWAPDGETLAFDGVQFRLAGDGRKLAGRRLRVSSIFACHASS